jgi:hypothetical protein
MWLRLLARILPGVVWSLGMISLLWGLYSWNYSSYVMMACIATHVRIPAPLGQLPPFPDVFTNMAHIYSFALAPLLFCVWWYVGFSSYCWFLGGCALLIRWVRNFSAVAQIQERFHKTGKLPSDWFHNSPPLLRLPFPSNIHPFLLNIYDKQDFCFPCGVHIQHVEYRPQAASGRRPHLDIWRKETYGGIQGESKSRPLFFFIHGM